MAADEQKRFQQTGFFWAGILLVILASVGQIGLSNGVLPEAGYLPITLAQVLGTGLLFFEVFRQRKRLGGGKRVGFVIAMVAIAIGAFGVGVYVALV